MEIFTAEVAWDIGEDTTKEELDENKWAGPSLWAHGWW